MRETRYQVTDRLYPYVPGARGAERHKVVIVGAGPVGLALALDLGLKGIPVLVLDDHEGPGEGSRAICFAKRTLEIADRLGAGASMLEKGVVWNVGKVFHGPDKVFEFDLLAENGHKAPAFINLQQPYFEAYLVAQIRKAQEKGAPIDLRGRNAVTGITPSDDHARLDIDTPDGSYQITADWVCACDGAGSPLRKMMGLGFEGRVFEDNFLIADIHMTAEFPPERWFWFEPPFRNAGQSALLHKQPDDIWRLDFQLGWDIDRAAELAPDRIRARVDAMLGEGAEYDLRWTSIYTFQCRRMQKFRHGRVLFVGDSAHQVSPFGARGANSGVQDADNLAWKLAMVLDGDASERLIDSYCAERRKAADENILNSTRSTDFLTPKSAASRLFRDAVLRLARNHAFARPLVNSGRLSVPCVYDAGEDGLAGPERTRPGAACVDAPLDDGYLLDRLGGEFVVLALNCAAPEVSGVRSLSIDAEGVLAARYLCDAPQALYLIRPDQHIAARWAKADAATISAALNRCLTEEF